MLYLHEENGKYYLPDVIWKMIKEYTGIYHIENVTLTRTMPLDNMYSLYRMWFGRFTLPDEYDMWNNNDKKIWLFKNLVSPNYLLNENKYNDMINMINS